MPGSLRGRLAFAGGLLLFTMIGVYAIVAGLFIPAQAAVRLHPVEDTLLVSETDTLAIRVHRAYQRGDDITNNETESNPPTAGPDLIALVENTGGFIWVVDRHELTFYSSSAVRRLAPPPPTTDAVAPSHRDSIAAMHELTDAERIALDTLVGSVPVAGTVVSGGDSIASIAGAAPRRAKIHGRDWIFYAMGVGFRPNGVNRVVIGRYAIPPPVRGIDFLVPFLIALPIFLGAAVLFGRVALGPMDARVDELINEVAAISDGRSLHRRLPGPGDAPPSDSLTRLSSTLNAMIGRLEQSFGGLRRFTADASHELKTPLTVLRADVERAMSTQGNPSEQLIALEESLAEITRMSDLVDSLLTLARADEGRFDLHREPVDLQALARDVFETTTLLGERTKINVKMAPPPPAVVLGDANRLRQLFLNLVTNAIKYTPAGGKVELALTVTGGTAHFSVRDSGIGIAAADLPRVFDRFWRADHARSRVGERGGVGLGLAISQYIAQAHGGTLTVQSKLGRGSVFTATLPLGGEKMHEAVVGVGFITS